MLTTFNDTRFVLDSKNRLDETMVTVTTADGASITLPGADLIELVATAVRMERGIAESVPDNVVVGLEEA